jgi:exonuclease SbcC
MIPLRIALKGFMSYRDRQTVDFTGAPLWVLAGPNGSGKSTIFDALTFVLFGVYRASSREAHLEDLINHHSDGVDIEFDFSLNGTVYRVKRTLKRRGATTYGAFTVDKDGHPRAIPDTDSSTGLQRWVRETIGLSREAFVTCVLLRQGKADALLNEEPIDRYKILSNLIDLSHYRRLHENVDKKRKQLVAEADVIKRRFQGMSDSSNAEIEAAEHAFSEAYEAMEATQAEVRRLTTLAEQARQWEGLQAQLTEARCQIVETSELLDRAKEIAASDARWQELDRYLPRVEAVVDARARLEEFASQRDTLARHTAAMHQEIDAATKALAKARAAQAAADTKVGEAQAAVAEARQEAEGAERLASQLTTLEAREAELRVLLDSMSAYQDDLDDQIGQARRRVEELREVREAMPLLARIVEGRNGLATAHLEAEAARERRDKAERELATCDAELARVSATVRTAEATERDSNNHVQQLATRHKDAVATHAHFEDVAHELRCSLCGQLVTPEHAAVEIARLRADVEAAASQLANASAEHARAVSALDEVRAAVERCREAQRTAEAAQREHVQVIERASHDEKRSLRELDRAWQHLALYFQQTISSQPPDGTEAWLAITWPTNGDLDSLQEEAATFDTHQAHLDDLQAQQRTLTGLTSKRDEAQRNIALLAADFDRDAARQAREGLPELESRRQAVEDSLSDATEAVLSAKAHLETADSRLESLRQRREHLAADRARVEATCQEIESQIGAECRQLDEIWVPAAMRATPEDVAAWHQEHESLADFPEQSRRLLGAHARLEELERQEQSICRQMDAIPVEARQSSSELYVRCAQAEDARRRANTRQVELHAALDHIIRARDEREQIARELRQVDRQAHLHTRLANLLGRGGLQMALLRRAERAIIEEANQILDRLSGGRMRLTLRKPDGLSDNALDLLYHDDETATEPIPIGLASGSQRFRIAVSLALAIGRYLSRESQRFQSVIIDEGFGSLDKTGRDDMIAVLRDLQTELERIILVSHQEEIAEAFPNSYTVRLVDGASRVSLAAAD